MAIENQLLEYNATKLELKEYLEYLEKSGINMDFAKKSFSEIESDLKEEQESNCFNITTYQIYITRLNYLKARIETEIKIQNIERYNISMDMTRSEIENLDEEMERLKSNKKDFSIEVQKKIEKLYSLQERLEKDEKHCQEMDKLTTSIKTALDGNNQINMKDLYKATKELLNLLQLVTKLDEELGKSLAEIVYQVVYSYLKIEAIYSKESKLLNEIRNNPVQSTYIIERMKNDIKTLSSESQEIITNQENKNKSLLYRETMVQIASSSNEKYIAYQKEQLKNSLVELTKIKEQFVEKKKKTEENIANYKESKWNFAGGIFAFTLSLLERLFYFVLFTGSALAIGASLELDSRAYEVITTTYDTGTGKITKEANYTDEPTDETTITEVTPWEKYGNNHYRRFIITYEVEPKSDTKIEEYLSSANIISSSTNMETSSKKPDNFGKSQQSTYRVVEKEKSGNYKSGTGKIIPLIFLLPFWYLYGLILATLDDVHDYTFGEVVNAVSYASERKTAAKKKIKLSTAELKEISSKYQSLLKDIKNNPTLNLLEKELENTEKEKLQVLLKQ